MSHTADHTARTARGLADKIDALVSLVGSIDGPGYPDALGTVQALRMIAETAESAQRQAVAQARAEGASWDQVARYLGVTRQSACERYGGV